MKKKVLRLLLLLIAALVLVPYALNVINLKPLDEQARASLDETYLSSPHGEIAYTRSGSPDDPAVVLVHGFSTPKFVWNEITPMLVAGGYQVITFDHLGRGFSERPVGPYDEAFYRTELGAVIKQLQLSTPLTLVGYSMGGANVADYTAANPEDVSQLVLIAPAGYMPTSRLWQLLQVPIVGEWLMTVAAKARVNKALQAEVDAGRTPPAALKTFAASADYRGFTEALLSTVRHYPMQNRQASYQAIGKLDIPVSAIWGTADKVVPYSGAQAMLADVPQLTIDTIVDGDHNITFARANLVGLKILAALDKTRPSTPRE